MSDQSTPAEGTTAVAEPEAAAPTAPTGFLADMAEILELAKAYTGDITSTGASIRLVRGQESIMVVDGQRTFMDVPDKIAFTRASVRDQGGMLVMSIGFTLVGETIGVFGPDNAKVLLPAYVADSFANWRTWAHTNNTEFMNVNPESAEMIHQALLEAGYVPYSRKPRPGQVVRERTAEVLWDLEPKGNTVQERHAKALTFEQVVLIPDVRVGPLETEYLKDGETVSRMGFTSYVDVVQFNTARLLKLLMQDPSSVENWSAKVSEMRNALSVITGMDESTDERYTLRPTLGRFFMPKPVQGDDETPEAYEARLEGLNDFQAGREVSLFPIKEEPAAAAVNASAAAQAYGKEANPFAPKGESGDAVASALSGDQPEPPD